jgi:transcriptional regulator with XRE-family HTH domain
MQTQFVIKSLHTAEYKTLRRMLQVARETSGLTQLGLASRIGKPQSFISKIESGERRLDIVEFITICRALGLEPWRLLRRFTEKSK